MNVNIEELKQKALAATPGPWEYTNDSKDFPVNGYVTVRDCIYSVCVLPYDGIRTDARVTANGRFIAAANPTAILALIAERDELLTALKESQCVNFWVSCQRDVVEKCMCAGCIEDRVQEVIAKVKG